MKRLGYLLFDYNVISVQHFAYLVRTKICLKPSFPPHFHGIDLGPVAEASFKIARVESEIDKAVSAAFYLVQFNKGQRILDGLRFLQNLIKHYDFNINKFRVYIGLYPIAEDDLLRQETRQVLVPFAAYYEIAAKYVRRSKWDPDAKVTESSTAFIAHYIMPVTNVLTAEHVAELTTVLKMFQCIDPAVRCFVDLIALQNSEPQYQMTDSVESNEYHDVAANTASDLEDSMEPCDSYLLSQIYSLLFGDFYARRFSGGRKSTERVIHVLKMLRRTFEADTDYWPGQQPLLRLAQQACAKAAYFYDIKAFGGQNSFGQHHATGRNSQQQRPYSQISGYSAVDYRYELKFDRMLHFLTGFLNHYLGLGIRRLHTVTEFAALLASQLRGFHLRELLENEGFSCDALQKRARKLEETAESCRHDLQPLITANIDRIFSDVTFTGTNRALSLLLQIDSLVRRNKLIQTAFALLSNEQLYITDTSFVFLLYAMFFALRSSEYTLAVLLERYEMIKQRRELLQKYQNDDSITFSNYDELIDYYRECKIKQMQIAGTVVYTFVMNKVALSQEVEEYFEHQTELDWFEYIVRNCAYY